MFIASREWVRACSEESRKSLIDVEGDSWHPLFITKPKELMIEERNSALREKELLIAEKDKLLEAKSKDITLLQNEIDTIQRKGEAEVTKAYARVSELERQVEKLEEFLGEQKKRQQRLELQGTKSENQAKDFSAKNKKVYAAEHWAKCVKPAVNVVLKKASEKATTAHNQEGPHLETAKTKWSPALKKQWQEAMASLAPHVENLKTKANEGYEVSRDTIKPHLVKAQDSLSPLVQTVKDLCGPYVDQVVAASQPHIEKVIAASQPHVEKVTDVLQPYTNPVRHAYGRFLTTATKYHRQIRATFQTSEIWRSPSTPQDEMHA